MTETWGERLKRALEAERIDKSAAARAIGVTYKTVLRWTQDEGTPKPEHRPRLAALGKPFKDLVAELPEPTPAAGTQPTRAELARGLAEASTELERLASALALLASAQRPALRRQLLAVLAREQS